MNNLIDLAEKLDEIKITLSLYRQEKFLECWSRFVDIWNSNEDLWKEIGENKLLRIELAADESFKRYTKNWGHHIGFLESCLEELSKILREEFAKTWK